MFYRLWKRNHQRRNLGTIYAEHGCIRQMPFVEPGERATALLKLFAMKYYPNEQLVDEEIMRAGKAAQLFEIEIEHLSGKEVQER